MSDQTLESATRYCPTCVMCGKTFISKRKDARTCGASCRNKLSRWRKRLDFHYKRALAEVKAIEEYLNYSESKYAAVFALTRVSKRCGSIMRDHNVKPIE